LPGLPGSLEPGSRWLLHLNDALYAHSAFVQGGAGSARSDGRWYVSTLSPAPVVEAQVQARFFGQTDYPLAQLRQALAPLQAAMTSAGLNHGQDR
jgi:hypothetical protein